MTKHWLISVCKPAETHLLFLQKETPELNLGFDPSHILSWDSHLRALTLVFCWPHLNHIYSDFITTLLAERTQWVQVNQRGISSPSSSSNLHLRTAKGKKRPTTTRSWSLHPHLLYCLNVIWGDALKMSKMNRYGKSVSILQALDGLSRRRSLKCLGLTMLLWTLRAIILVPTLGCKTAHGSTLGRKALLSVSASAAEASMAEASLLPVCAISGLGAFVSSSHTSG